MFYLRHMEFKNMAKKTIRLNKQYWANFNKDSIKNQFQKFIVENQLQNSFLAGESFLKEGKGTIDIKDYGFNNEADFIVWLTGCAKPDFY